MASVGSGIRLIAYDDQQKLLPSIRNAIPESFEVFQELSACMSYIEKLKDEDRVVVVLSTSTEGQVLQDFEDSKSVEAILILSAVNIDVSTLPSKVFGVSSEQEGLLRQYADAFDEIELRLNVTKVLFGRNADGTDNLWFYFYHVWKNNTNGQYSTKKVLADEGRILFRTNHNIKAHINNFENTYKPNDVLNWLDRRRYPFPYNALISHALRSRNVEILSLCRCFLDDLSKQMKPAPPGGNYKQLCYGTKLPIDFVEQLEQKTNNDIIAFQSFLPVTQSRAIGLANATRPTRRQNLINALLKIDLNNTPCATVGETIVVDMATPFHIVCVTRSSGNSTSQQTLVVIKLKAFNLADRDSCIEEFIQRQAKLGRPAEYLLKRINGEISDDEALADDHMSRSEWTAASTILARIPDPSVRVLNKRGSLFRDHLHDFDNAILCHQKALSKAVERDRAQTLVYLGLAYKSKKQYTEAYKAYGDALEWFENEKKRDPVMISRCLAGVGVAHWGLKNFPEALDYTQRALKIRECEIEPRDEGDIAGCLGNMSNIFHDQGDLNNALSFGLRTVEILSKSGKKDQRLTAALNNLATIHQAMGDLVRAREYFQRALDSTDNEYHPHRRSTLSNLATLDLMEKQKK